jgi:hypothetical protein
MAQKRLFLSDQKIDLEKFMRAQDDSIAAQQMLEALNAGMHDVISLMTQEGFKPDPSRIPSIVMTFQAPGVKE